MQPVEKMARRAATRKLLWQWGNTLRRIQRLEKEREAFQSWAADARTTLRAQNITGMPRGGQKTDLADVIERIAKRAEMFETQEIKIDAEIRDALRLKNCIDEIVAEMEPAQQRVLEYRYIDGHGWQYIAMKMSYDERHVRKIEAEAVDKISEFVLVE